jgi:hypothetical protein
MNNNNLEDIASLSDILSRKEVNDLENILEGIVNKKTAPEPIIPKPPVIKGKKTTYTPIKNYAKNTLTAALMVAALSFIGGYGYKNSPKIKEEIEYLRQPSYVVGISKDNIFELSQRKNGLPYEEKHYIKLSPDGKRGKITSYREDGRQQKYFFKVNQQGRIKSITDINPYNIILTKYCDDHGLFSKERTFSNWNSIVEKEKLYAKQLELRQIWPRYQRKLREVLRG